MKTAARLLCLAMPALVLVGCQGAESDTNFYARYNADGQTKARILWFMMEAPAKNSASSKAPQVQVPSMCWYDTVSGSKDVSPSLAAVQDLAKNEKARQAVALSLSRSFPINPQKVAVAALQAAFKKAQFTDTSKTQSKQFSLDFAGGFGSALAGGLGGLLGGLLGGGGSSFGGGGEGGGSSLFGSFLKGMGAGMGGGGSGSGGFGNFGNFGSAGFGGSSGGFGSMFGHPRAGENVISESSTGGSGGPAPAEGGGGGGGGDVVMALESDELSNVVGDEIAYQNLTEIADVVKATAGKINLKVDCPMPSSLPIKK